MKRDSNAPSVNLGFDLQDLDLEDIRILTVDEAYLMPEMGASQAGFWNCCSVVLDPSLPARSERPLHRKEGKDFRGDRDTRAHAARP
ncbi:hypothetical protein [Deinococcus cellulosilyticus]|uniref:Uncharacterized protein n=1 Tax=Deinococcus cellulosilyticus (strain DSM 18568 / NBRC 106333 / KACC 11606 / 5516J-15) TaxID=1223518 RepID=A0A511N308_DEIC1|nr:hypothetical protein [Deinococcus cellulosilyticus]GEM46887.1 hypothetical protein DC3_25220 [Deinococcus cellulosilyticus NBRC 106333 = KACC 11606]